MEKLILLTSAILLTFALNAQTVAENLKSENNLLVKISPNLVTDSSFRITSCKAIKKVEILNIIGRVVQEVENEGGD